MATRLSAPAPGARPPASGTRPPVPSGRPPAFDGRAPAPDEPLRFFLDFAEAEGGLCERAEDAALVVMPKPLSAELDVAEDVTLTADPEVAREDGAILMVHGHPLLDRAASLVLARGDVGHLRLPWPASALPRAGEVVQRARESLQVDHGKIEDVGAAPVEAYLPVLRVGALVSYATTLEDRFQEREEVWVDACSGLEVEPALRTWILGRAREPGTDRSRTILACDLAAAVAVAHRLVDQRAVARRAELARQSRGTYTQEMARATAYYAAALDSIASRAAAAPPQRRDILAAQAEVTAAERDRRLAEIAERNEARHQVQPFRIHVIGVPALSLPVAVRRGDRAFPLTLTWMLGGAGLANVLCPHCGAAAELVAGRQRLGCRVCLARRPSEAAASPGSPVPAPASARPPAAPDRPEPRSTRPPAAPDRPEPRSSRPTPAATRASPPGRRRAPSPSETGAGRLDRSGRRLATTFWEAAVTGSRWRTRTTVPRSPLAALIRLYGIRGALWAIGVPPEASPFDLLVERTQSSGAIAQTSGRLATTQGTFPYCLRWQMESGDALAGEILPYPSPTGALLPASSAASGRGHQLRHPPAPRIELDAVATKIWDHAVATHGLNLAARCLALWWEVEPAVDNAVPGDEAMIKAVDRIVRGRAALPDPHAGQSMLWGPDDSSIEDATMHVLGLVGPPENRPW